METEAVGGDIVGSGCNGPSLREAAELGGLEAELAPGPIFFRDVIDVTRARNLCDSEVFPALFSRTAPTEPG